MTIKNTLKNSTSPKNKQYLNCLFLKLGLSCSFKTKNKELLFHLPEYSQGEFVSFLKHMFNICKSYHITQSVVSYYMSTYSPLQLAW